MRAPIRTHIPTLLWALVVAVALLTPGPELERITRPPNWIAGAAHLVLFMVMAWVLHRSLAGEGVRRALALSFLTAFVYGGALEFGQIPIEGRGLEAFDFMMNGAGALIGVFAARLSS